MDASARAGEALDEEFDIAAWIRDRIEGPGGMNDFERHELVIWHVSDRIAAATWLVRCLANPRCEGSDAMLKSIIDRRNEVGE